MAVNISADVSVLRKFGVGAMLLVALSVIGMGKAVAQSINTSILPPDRATVWNPGMMGVGGIPVRSTVCSMLTPRGGGLDDTAQIQAAIKACPAGQVVQLSAGTFIINNGNFVLVNQSITLRGAGPGQTILKKTDGAAPYPAPALGPNPSPIVIVGPAIWGNVPDSSNVAGSADLTADAVKGAYSVTVASTANFSAGQIVLLDEASGAGWQTDPVAGGGQIWAAPDWRVVWKKHNPPLLYVDDFAANDYPTTPGTAGQWFSRLNRPTSEIKQIASISGSTITFTTPIHISYRAGNTAQLSWYGYAHVQNAGVEDLTLTGGDNSNLIFNWAAQSWAKNVESSVWLGVGVGINASFRIELREFYIHDAAWIQPGGGAYAISMEKGTSEVLIEDGISVRANKVMVARCAGAGSVVGYNYMDMGYINYNGAWIEIGLNASHMVGPHHVLFEGNYGFNADSDDTHGNSIYHTFFRNYLPGVRAPFINQQGLALVDDANQPDGPKRAAGPMAYSYWMSFVGNVLGAPGKMAGWVYETTFGTPGIWMLGWENTPDRQVAATILRHGNFDFVTNSQIWDPAISNHTLPNSFYLTTAPSFFSGYTWPWTDPSNGTVNTLPAKARYDSGNPFGLNTPVINSPLTAKGTIGTAFSYQITATNNPTIYSASSLPAGLTVNTSTGVISGTPTTATTTNVTISATNASGTGSATLVITINGGPTASMAGETNVLRTAIGNLAGALFQQNVTVPQKGTLRSMSIYVAHPVGQVILGMYNTVDGICGNGARVAQTPAFTLVAGWNTINTSITPQVTAGKYCLTWTPSSNSAQVVYGRTAGTTTMWRPFPFQLPSPWGTPTGNNANHISLYATFSVP